MAAPTQMQFQQMHNQMNQQQMNPQQMGLPQMNPQQMGPQMTPQQMGQPMNPQQMGQQMNPQQMTPQQIAQAQAAQAQAQQQQQQQQPPPNPGAGAQQPQQQQHGDYDPIYKFKALLPRLKESLSNLFRAAGEVFKHHATQDSGTRTGENPQQKFEKSLEEFYALCDQIEMNLKFALEMHSQSLDSMKYTPYHVTSGIKDAQQPDSMPYPQYLVNIKTQISWAKEIHDVLSDFAINLMPDSVAPK